MSPNDSVNEAAANTLTGPSVDDDAFEEPQAVKDVNATAITAMKQRFTDSPSAATSVASASQTLNVARKCEIERFFPISGMLACMPSYRIGQAAEVLGVSPDTVRRWVDAGRLNATRDKGDRRHIEGKALATFAVEIAQERAVEQQAAGSARNRFPGIITKVVKDTVAAHVEIQAGPHRIVSLITREAVDELGLEAGVLAIATVKATSVMINGVDIGNPAD